MTTRSFRRFSIFALLPIMLVASPGAGDTQQALHLELNKMLTEQGRCRIFFVVENPLDRAFSKLVLDVAFFDKKGIIIGRSDIDLGKVRGRKTTVRSFSFVEFDCATVGKVLLNDVVACGPQITAGERQDCLDVVRLTYRGDVEFFK